MKEKTSVEEIKEVGEGWGGEGWGWKEKGGEKRGRVNKEGGMC